MNMAKLGWQGSFQKGANQGAGPQMPRQKPDAGRGSVSVSRDPSTHLLLHDGHRGPCQQEGLEWHQAPECVLHLVVAGDDICPGLAGGAEEDCPGRGQKGTGTQGVVTQAGGRLWGTVG